MEVENLIESYFMLVDSTHQSLISIGRSGSTCDSLILIQQVQNSMLTCMYMCVSWGRPYSTSILNVHWSNPWFVFFLGEYIDDTEDLINIQLDYRSVEGSGRVRSLHRDGLQVGRGVRESALAAPGWTTGR